MKRIIEILVVAVILSVLVAMLLPALQNVYVPTSDSIRNSSTIKAFMVAEEDLQGIDGNHYIDALIFRYRTTIDDRGTFESKLDQQAATAGWAKISRNDGADCYERLTPKGDRMFAGAEQTRVTFAPDTNQVTIGWVQGDTVTDVNSFSDESESSWADSNVWPLLDSN